MHNKFVYIKNQNNKRTSISEIHQAAITQPNGTRTQAIPTLPPQVILKFYTEFFYFRFENKYLHVNIILTFL